MGAVGAIPLEEVLHMNAGNGDKSYVNNSLLQKKVTQRAKPVLQESIRELYGKNFPECITMEDMGCSSGPNAFLPIGEVTEAIDETCNRLNRKPPILQVFLNDLPGNDFNSIFKSLPCFYKKLEEEKKRKSCSCFIAAVPGNFYGRLFPPKFLHFVDSSYGLHWCSESHALRVRIMTLFLAKTSQPGVYKAYLHQFEADFKKFLRSRSEEMVSGCLMVLTIYGRDKIMNQLDKYKPDIWELFGIMLNGMVLQGLIEESKLDSFNVSFYKATAEEVKNVIESEGSFSINQLQSFHIGWDESVDDRYKDSMDKYTRGMYVANNLRAATKPILANQFGCELIDVVPEIFCKDCRLHGEKVRCIHESCHFCNQEMNKI